MPRGKAIIKRPVEPDPIYNSRLVTKLINKTMRHGKKTVAAAQVYKALDLIKQRSTSGDDPAKVLEQAVNAIAPRMEVRSRRVGGASYQVPSEVRGERKLHLAMRWLIDAARARSNKEFHTFAQKLAAEVTNTLAGQSNALKKRDQVHKMAEANRAFAHLRW